MKPAKQILIALFLMFTSVANAQMVLECNISTGTQIALPLAGTVNVSVNWGDGSALEIFTTSGNKPHTFISSGTKNVTITGTLTAYGSPITSNTTLTKVLSWDGLGLKSFSYAFYGATSLIQVPTSLPASVTDISNMFHGAYSFDYPIGTWNTSAVTNMSFMFSSATFFTQPLDTWNTSAVTNMSGMFYKAVAFNQPIGNWNVTAVTQMAAMFNGAALCTDNYDNLLNGWASQAVAMNLEFDGGNSKYSPASAVARATLINKGWTIKDAGAGTIADAKCASVGIEDESINEPETILYPNPAKDKLTIGFTEPLNELFTYNIYNITGLLVLEKEIQSNGVSAEIGLEALPQGAYIIKIQSNENVIVRSFVKE